MHFKVQKTIKSNFDTLNVFVKKYRYQKLVQINNFNKNKTEVFQQQIFRA